MKDQATSRAIFAELVRHLEPYLGDIVLTGGWVHAMYLADANRGRRPQHWALHTDDIDFTIPPVLLTGDRPRLLELAEASGFTVRDASWMGEGAIEVVRTQGTVTIDLDFLTRANRPDEDIRIEGQDGLVAHGYPDLHILTENTEWIEAGVDIDPLLAPPIRIRVPTPAAYVLQKGLSSQRRSGPKVAKDIVYICEIVRHPGLGQAVRDDLPALGRRYPAEFGSWAAYLGNLQPNDPLMVDVVEQLMEANRAQGEAEVIRARTAAMLRRLVGEARSAIATHGE
jgi:hypothetical protein